ncbi:unnamed protein product, partial [Ectocarpus sp. 12 AP-2014]
MMNVIVDSSSGHVGVVSMLKNAWPTLNQNDILRKVKGTLEDFGGTKISKRLVEGRITSVVPSEACEYILDNIPGRGWDTWRAKASKVFKESLKNHVEHALRTQVKIDQADKQRQKQIAHRETKASSLLKALNEVNIYGTIRVDLDSCKGSIIDTIRVLCPHASVEYAAKMFARLLEKEGNRSFIGSRVSKIRVNGCGQKTPVADVRTVVEVVWMLPGSVSKAFRRNCAETICQIMGGDIRLCRQIEENNVTWMSFDGGEVIRNALTDPIEYKEEEKSTTVKDSFVRDKLCGGVGGQKEVQVPSGFIDVLSDTQVIEVKYYRQWKGGLGQVLAYHAYYPHLAKRLHLFAQVGDKDMEKHLDMAKSICDTHAVNLTFEQV